MLNMFRCPVMLELDLFSLAPQINVRTLRNDAIKLENKSNLHINYD